MKVTRRHQEKWIEHALRKIVHQFQSGILQSCTSGVWKLTEVATATGTSALIRTLLILVDMSDTKNACGQGNGLWFVSKLVTVGCLVIVLMNILRIGTGTIHSNHAFLVAWPLSQQEYSICAKEQLNRLCVLVRLSLGGLIYPWEPLGLSPCQIHKIRN